MNISCRRKPCHGARIAMNQAELCWFRLIQADWDWRPSNGIPQTWASLPPSEIRLIPGLNGFPTSLNQADWGIQLFPPIRLIQPDFSLIEPGWDWWCISTATENQVDFRLIGIPISLNQLDCGIQYSPPISLIQPGFSLMQTPRPCIHPQGLLASVLRLNGNVAGRCPTETLQPMNDPELSNPFHQKAIELAKYRRNGISPEFNIITSFRHLKFLMIFLFVKKS